jgi:hypothetical protein
MGCASMCEHVPEWPKLEFVKIEPDVDHTVFQELRVKGQVNVSEAMAGKVIYCSDG